MPRRGWTRAASHAGSWYSNDGTRLRMRLSEWVDKVHEGSDEYDGRPVENLRAIIAPHAGYEYSGSTAAHAYAGIDPAKYKRVIVLGPSHHQYLDDCALSAASSFETPLGTLKADEQLVEELYSSGQFHYMSSSVDEAEHSIELHLPYVAYIFRKYLSTIKVVTVLVGALSEDVEEKYGGIFSRYLQDPETLFIVSSDFCHWGRRFRFTYVGEHREEIYEAIERLDRMGISLIEKQEPRQFLAYLRKYSNTICGRHPIAVLLFALEECKRINAQFTVKFVRYRQSSQCKSKTDSSVSYASAHISQY
mmetsp:Transcript_3458/g.10479  ORF Transcript_3458/g.10479 Transcript_3458/m.10479 type:complete len:306 (+) Transcript_3458:125-1042(+)